MLFVAHLQESIHSRVLPHDERAAFLEDVKTEERASDVMMRQHAKYVGEPFDKGAVLIYGPVMAPRWSVRYSRAGDG